MDFNKDYYATLGILPNAEQELIKAAYRALSKLYHPDTYRGVDSEQRMAEINEAYCVLKDTNNRTEYDQARGHGAQDAETAFDEGFDDTEQALNESWQIAVKFHPQLEEYVSRLSKISAKLSFTYRSYLLETKQFEQAKAIASEMEHAFLNAYFGTDAKVIEFAKFLIKESKRDVLLELNKAIKVLGSSTSSKAIIDKIKATNNLYTQRELFGKFLSKCSHTQLSWVNGDFTDSDRDTVYNSWLLSEREARRTIDTIIQRKSKKINRYLYTFTGCLIAVIFAVIWFT